MKKAGLFFVMLCILFYYERYEVLDVSRYQRQDKQVEIKGEVQHPGVYTVPRHASVQEVIEAGGGITQQGDTATLNLAKDIENQGVVIVGRKQQKQRISINSADAEALDRLPGIGPMMAQRIIAYRTHSPFQSLTDLKEVKGIGDKLYEKLKDAICL